MKALEITHRIGGRQNAEMLIAAIADTHFPSRGDTLPRKYQERLAMADRILHAGDHCDAAALAALRQLGPPVISVHGNVDEAAVRRHLPHEVAFEADGIRIGMIHDAGASAGRSTRLRHRFRGAEVIVFDHSQGPLIERGDDGVLLINPGSPTDRRRQPAHTMAEFQITPGAPVDARLIALDGPDGTAQQND